MDLDLNLHRKIKLIYLNQKKRIATDSEVALTEPVLGVD